MSGINPTIFFSATLCGMLPMAMISLQIGEAAASNIIVFFFDFAEFGERLFDLGWDDATSGTGNFGGGRMCGVCGICGVSRIKDPG